MSPLTLSAAEPPSLPPVVVTATRTPQPVDAVLSDVRVIDADTIARAGTQTFVELLQAHGGVEISTTGGPGQVSGLFLRGANTNHVLLLVDGVRVNSATVGTNAFENLPLAQIERIEILRGPASSLYGADAIGGVIQVFTKQGPRTQASVGAGRWGTREASVGLGRSLGATRLSLQAGVTRSDAFSATNAAASPFSFNPDDDGYRNTNLGLSVEHDRAEGHTLALRLLASRGTTHFDSGPDSDDVNRQRLGSLALESRDRLAPGWRSLLRLARGSDHIRTEGAFPGRFDTDQDQATWQNDIAAFGGELVAGVEARREQVDSSTAYTRTSRRQWGLFGGYSATFGAQLVEASLRHDDDSQFGGHGSGKLAWGWRLAPQWRVSASAATAFKAPSFNDLYFPESFGFSGNPDLKPERARSVEVAARYDGSATRAGLVVFQNRIRDLIAVDPTFTTVINVNRARISGVTLDGSWQAGPWRLRGEWTNQQAEDADTGLRLVRRAQDFGSASLGYTGGAWRLGAELVASGDRYGTAANSATSRMGGYTLLHLTAGWRLTPEWTLSARLNNAGDKAYEISQGYNTPRRNLFVSLAYAGL
ncbi:MAG: TonB-dependent receptor [Piscinibacter sp.]|nr:TonB-dependent receptor [Piscinibacter sp.]